MPKRQSVLKRWAKRWMRGAEIFIAATASGVHQSPYNLRTGVSQPGSKLGEA